MPPELPEPALGINFARDGMQEKDWLSLVAVHSDSWLLAVAFYFGARFGFGKNERYVCFFFVNYGTLSLRLYSSVSAAWLNFKICANCIMLFASTNIEIQYPSSLQMSLFQIYLQSY